MSKNNLIPTSECDFLENDQAIHGQEYVCLSFLSPDDIIKQKELFIFNKYMNQCCGEFEKNIDDIIKKSSDELKNKIGKELTSKLRLAMKYNYDQFKDQFDNFKYKFGSELNNMYDKETNFRTSVRGVKIRGVYSTYAEAENRAKVLQKSDRSFHVFVGQLGCWLPWDPCADAVSNEEYLEDELNTLMKEYKANELKKNSFYEERKREKQEDALKERLAAEKKQKEDIENTANSLQEEDPWLKSKLGGDDSTEASNVENGGETTTDSGTTEASNVENGGETTTDSGTTEASNVDTTEASNVENGGDSSEPQIKVI